MKRLLTCLLVFTLLLGCFALGEGRSFTDSTGRELNLPENIRRVAVSGPLSQIVFFSLAPELLVGISVPWEEAAKPYIPEEYLDLPVLGQLYGTKGELNLESLLNAAPDIVIDIGEAKGSIKEDMDALTEQTGIPFVHIDASTETMGETYRILGDLLGMQDEAEVLADYYESIYARGKEIAEKVEKTSLLYILGSKGLNVIAEGSYHGEIIDLICDNAAVLEEPSSKGTGNEVDMEQILMWDPDFIVFAPDSVYDEVGSSELWQNLTAIQKGNYVEVPNGPYNWMGFPPSVQRLLGMMWLEKLLYPEQADYDLYEEVAQYYKLFYHSELSREDYDALMVNALR